VDEFPKLMMALEDEPLMVEIYTGKPKGWFKSIQRESFVKIIEEGERVNGDFFFPWAARKIARQEKLMPGMTAKILASTLPTGSPK
jgi:hypothetical protein